MGSCEFPLLLGGWGVRKQMVLETSEGRNWSDRRTLGRLL